VTIVVLLILLALWVAVLGPPVVRFFSGTTRSADSVGDFNKTLYVLGRSTPASSGRRTGGVAVLTPAQKRRRDILFGLGGAVGLSLLLAVGTGATAAWGLQLLTDALLGAFLFLLVQMRKRTAVQAKVAYLPAHTRPELGLRRVASWH